MIATADGQGLLAAIIDEPADDALRLIYADWLEENGQGERAEFIRVQVAIERLNAELLSDEDCEEPNCGGCRERAALNARQQDLLLATTPGQWSGINLVPGVGVGWKWRRGFVSEIRCPLDAWRQHGLALVREHPLERVEASCRRPCRYAGRWRWTWAWAKGWSEWGKNSPECLPKDVWDCLDDDGKKFAWETAETAVDALSAALIAWAKSQPA